MTPLKFYLAITRGKGLEISKQGCVGEKFFRRVIRIGCLAKLRRAVAAMSEQPQTGTEGTGHEAVEKAETQALDRSI
jgi:hypothetical protein